MARSGLHGASPQNGARSLSEKLDKGKAALLDSGTQMQITVGCSVDKGRKCLNRLRPSGIINMRVSSGNDEQDTSEGMHWRGYLERGPSGSKRWRLWPSLIR